ATLDLLDHRVDRLPPECLVRTRHVDQVRAMRHGVPDPCLGEGRAERLGVRLRQGDAVPSIVILCKQLDGLERDGMGCPDGPIATAGYGHVGPEFRETGRPIRTLSHDGIHRSGRSPGARWLAESVTCGRWHIDPTMKPVDAIPRKWPGVRPWEC